MANIYDYCLWRGDLSFFERPFNDTDNLVLCLLSYIDLQEVFPKGEAISLHDVLYFLLEENKLKTRVLDGEQNPEQYTAFARAAADSRRFGSLILENYIDIWDKERQTQFCAVTFHLDKDTDFIAFRGTDDSLIGWKEDFMISFKKIPAQEIALEYTKSVLKRGRKAYIGGHSKGANLALYAAALLPEEYRPQLLHVYVNDGPGLCSDVLDTSVISVIDPITTKIVPEYDVVGKIFEMPITDCRIVKSAEKGVQQHSLITWQLLEGGSLDLAIQQAPGSIWIGEILDKWIGGVSSREREIFVNDLFDTLSACGADTFSQMSSMEPEDLEKILSEVSGINTVTLDVATSLPLTAVGVEKKKNPSLTEYILGLFHKDTWSRSFLLIIIGICCLQIPESLMPLTVGIAMTGAVIYEAWYCLKRLKEENWDVRRLQMQIYIFLGSLLIYAIILIKEGALMLISNLVYGGVFLFLAYHIFGRLEKDKKFSFSWFYSVLEGVVLIFMAIFVLTASTGSISTFTFALGIVLTFDGFLHLFRNLRRKYKKHKKKTPANQ